MAAEEKIDRDEDRDKKISDKIIKRKAIPQRSLDEKSYSRLQFSCKLLAWIVIAIATAYHIRRVTVATVAAGERGGTCRLLFYGGAWLGERWQPNGCMMHSYTVSETRTCLKGQRLAFIGDSRMRALYYQLAETVSTTTISTGKKHSDMSFKDKSNTSIEFYWSTDLDPRSLPSAEAILKKISADTRRMPRLILFGVGTWLLKNQPVTALVDYQQHMRSMLPMIATVALNIRTKVRFMDQESLLTRFHREPQIVWMMQDPVVPSKLHEARASITNEKIDLLNAMANAELSEVPHLRILNASTLMARARPAETTDGIHYSSVVLDAKLNVLLNAFCNDYIFPDDATCCKDIETITQLQYNTFAVFAACLVLWLLMSVSRACRNWRRRRNAASDDSSVPAPTDPTSRGILAWFYSETMYVGMTSMTKLAVIMIYFFIADRSHIYMEGSKEYSHAKFVLPIIMMLVGGIATWTPALWKTKPSSKVGKVDHSVLNKAQCNEIRGWLITTIMLAKYTDAERFLPVYVHIRLFIAAFLFLLGFQYFQHFWHKENYGIYTLCKVLIRMNMFCALLCLIMGRPYAFYYLVPLLSFWFLVLFVSMAMWPRVSDRLIAENSKRYAFVAWKFASLFAVVFVVWGYASICDRVFSVPVIKELFVEVNGGVQHWRLRSALDRYAVILGMFVSFVYSTLKKKNVISDSTDSTNWLFNSPRAAVIASAISVVALFAYEVHAVTCRTQESCNFVHTIASGVPIIAFVVLRNMPPFLRNHYSQFFAWVGEMSLELFIAQYHIWLANDTHGILVLIPGYPTTNAIITSFTFIWITHEAAKLCRVLSDLLVTKDVLVMLRRLVFFIIMLLVIWYHKTHEQKPALF